MSRPRSLGALEKEARAAATFRGHALGRWLEDRDLDQPLRAEASATCTSPGCDAYVRVMMSPPANGIDIGGPAVAIGCPAPIGR